jgi:hypothetical protein
MSEEFMSKRFMSLKFMSKTDLITLNFRPINSLLINS